MEFMALYDVEFDWRGDIYPLHLDPVACRRAVWWVSAACERATQQPMPGLCQHRIRNLLEHREDGSCVICGCSREYDSFGDRVCFCDLCSRSGCTPARKV